jgi:thiol peroxidase
MTDERTGEAFELGKRFTVVGRKLLVGEPAPPFTLEYLNPSTMTILHVRLADSAGTVRLLNIVKSIDTPVCQAETLCWEKNRVECCADFVLYTISMDLPFALARWIAEAGMQHIALSAHRSSQFGRDYGVLLKESRLLQRAVFVITRNDRLAYTLPQEMAIRPPVRIPRQPARGAPLPRGRSTTSTHLPASRSASRDAPSPGSVLSHACRTRSRSSRHGRTPGTPVARPSGFPLSGILHRR